MKIHSFNSEFAPAGIEPKSSRSNGNPPPDNNSEPKAKNSGNLTSLRGIVTEKDRIELNLNRAVVSMAEGSKSVPRSDHFLHIGEDRQNATYSPEIIAGKSNVLDNDLREIRLMKIGRQIAEGYYNKPEFIEKLAEKLIEGFYLSEEKR